MLSTRTNYFIIIDWLSRVPLTTPGKFVSICPSYQQLAYDDHIRTAPSTSTPFIVCEIRFDGPNRAIMARDREFVRQPENALGLKEG